MFVLNNTGIWNFPICIVYRCHALIIRNLMPFQFKAQTSVFQLTVTIIKVLVNGTGIDNSISKTVPMLSVLQIIYICLHFYSFEKPINQNIVTTNGHALIAIVKVVIIIGITHREAANNESRQFCTWTAPLLFSVSLDEFLIDIGTNEGNSLLF